MLEKFLENLKPTELVLTANKRLANYLQSCYDKYQQKAGCLSWESPNFFPLTTWISVFYQENRTEVLQVLSPTQSLVLWEDIIRSSGAQTLQSVKTAELAYQAWQLVKQWEVPLSDVDPVFNDWAIQFIERCEQDHLIDEASLLSKVLDVIKKGNRPLPSRIHFVGFDNISILNNKLLNNIKPFSEVVFQDFQFESSQYTSIQLQNEDQEMLVAARWVMHQLNADQYGQIGVIVPDLLAKRSKITQCFESVIGQDLINISAGRPLADYPDIAAALRSLRLLQGDLSYFELKAIMSSPYIQTDITLPDELYPEQDSLGLSKTLLTIPDEQKPSAWVQTFQNFLESLGWLSELSEPWSKVLNDFSQLNHVVDQLNLERALSIFKNLVKSTLYQSPTPKARVHIIGLLESAGLLFDALWVMGFDDETWPQPLQPNPFIPSSLQREKNMPRSNPQHEVHYAKNMLNRLMKSGRNVVVSYAKYQDDKPLEPSPLIKNIPKCELSELALATYIPQSKQLFDQRQLETIENDDAPPVRADENIRGGTSILKSQAICPFKAFAEVRLNAVSGEEPVLGFDAAERGNFVHEILAKFWSEVKDSDGLQHMSETELDKTINSAIDSITASKFSPFPRKQESGEEDSRFRGNGETTDIYINIERKRLFTLIKSWLHYEKNRSPFKVSGIEQSLTTTIGGLALRCRIDRIDQLENGTHIIIDYKTGKTSVNSWFSERPDDPQLPLYCVVNEHPISAVAFAEIRPENKQFKGISRVDKLLPDVKPVEKFHDDWDALLNEWKSNLTQLAKDFLSGHAEVDPKHPILSCQFCELDSLCRIR